MKKFATYPVLVFICVLALVACSCQTLSALSSEPTNILSPAATSTPQLTSILRDADRDGLPDKMEQQIGANREKADTDGDSLSDYAEVVKYKTNPLEADSDGDGLSDQDWEERREYSYSVRVLMKIRQPFDLESMNDLYQDVRILQDPDPAGYTRIEAILYPETRAVLNASVYPLEDLPEEAQRYTQPGVATNYNTEMQTQVLEIVSGAQTDLQVVEKVQQWVREETNTYLDYSIAEVYFTYLENGRVQVRNYSADFPVEDLLRTHYFADSMFREKTHGTCTSIATLKCAMFKAAGIPCRLVQTIPLVFYHGSQAETYENHLNREWGGCAFELPVGFDQTYANHAFSEVFLGGQWQRVDQNIGIYDEDPHCLSLKILSAADWGDVDFSETWPVDWINNRPFYTLLLEDQEAQNK